MDIEIKDAVPINCTDKKFALGQENERTNTLHTAEESVIMRNWHRIAVIVLLCAMLAEGISNIMAMSVTWDEVMYIGIGNFVLRTAHIDFKHIDGLHFHPIGTFYLNSLLLLFMNLPASTLQIPSEGLYTFTAARNLLFNSGYSPETILFLIRLPILLQTLFLGFLVHRFATRLFGIRAGLLALALLAFDPNLLAHSAIACTDSSVTVWLFASVYAYYEYLKNPSKKQLMLTGLSVGTACLCKVSAPLLLAFIMPSMYLTHNFASLKESFLTRNLFKKEDGKKISTALVAQLHQVQHLLVIGLTAAFMIWAAYGFGLSINYKTPEEIAASGAHGVKAVMQSTNFIRLPLAPYANVVAFVTMGAVGIPRHAYLLGQNSADGFRTYATMNFLIKTPLPVLLLLLLTLALFKWLPRADSTAEMAIAISCLVQFFFATFEHANCGIRYILPVYPFLYLLICRLAPVSQWKLNLTSAARLPIQIGIVALIGWNAVESVKACPNQIAYFNTLINDPKSKCHYVVDSNLDWGNELYALRDYMREHQINDISLQYFGNVDPADYGIKYKQANADSHGWVAISATNLVGAYLEKDEFAAFRTLEPKAVLCGGGMFVYHR